MRKRSPLPFSAWLMSALLVVVIAALAGCGLTDTGSINSAPNVPSGMNIYFTAANGQASNGVDQYPMKDVEAAKKTLDIASFDFNLPNFTAAVVKAKQRGVQVRIVLDEENGSQRLSASDSPTGKSIDAVRTLQNAGITVVDGGRSNGLMHDKFIIVDDAVLYVGSWNMSYNDTYRNNNNLLRIADKTLIDNYEAKFTELYVEKQFGTHATVGAQTPRTTLDGVTIENYFSPVDNVMQKIIAEVNSAKSSVKFMAFTYTYNDLAQAMIARQKAGDKVEGVIENRGASQGAMPELFCAKVPVEVDGNKYTMHHKVIIIDDNTVITGSFNFTKSADTANDDNILIIHSSGVAALYNAEFEKVYGAGKAPSSVDCSTVKPPTDSGGGEG
jgi:phosphatidylserine/phosphatidylglycerophosphate/cardiolipin synthase-like enzyme